VSTEFVLEQLGLSGSEWAGFLKATSLEGTIVYADPPTNAKINAKETQALLMAALGS
jgi:hypothetical protein